MLGEIASYLGIIAALIAIGGFFGHLARRVQAFEGWDFQIIHTELSARIVYQGSPIIVSAIVKNTGRKAVATYYGVIKIAYAYGLQNPIHDTDRDLPLSNKSRLRIADVVKSQTSHLDYEYRVPDELPIGIYYVSVEIWNPHQLYGGKYPKCFDTSEWNMNFEVLRKEEQCHSVP